MKSAYRLWSSDGRAVDRFGLAIRSRVVSRALSQTRSWGTARPVEAFDRIAAVVGLGALAVLPAVMAVDAIDEPSAVAQPTIGDSSGTRASGALPWSSLHGWSAASFAAGERMVGGYGGVSFTNASPASFANPSAAADQRTDFTVSGFGWEGQPFKSPIYYGLRAIAWPTGSRLGTMLDFTHAKAIARPGDVATFTGTLDGQTLPATAPVRDVFKHFEFSHGHNMVTLNGLVGLGWGVARLRPYVGAGAGIALPHTEIGYRKDKGRTYEYQYAGLVGQALAGVEVRLGRTSVFFEYKLSYAPYDVPLSGTMKGGLLVTDLWRQLRAWTRGEPPPGGRARTTLVTQHGIVGALVRVAGGAATP